MEETFRLEFNEEQQWLRLGNYSHEVNTNGFITVFEHCTNQEFWIFQSYVKRIPKRKLTNEYILKCKSEIVPFMNNLIENKLKIVDAS